MSIKGMQAAAQFINNSDTGYNQAKRWSFYDGRTVVRHKECDCSSCCGVIAKLGGYDVSLKGMFYTGNIAAKFKAAGFTVSRFSGMKNIRAGDFVVKVGKHVEFVYAEDLFFSAHIDERGRASGGRPGNQTGKEVCFRKAYNYKGGWDYVLRPPKDKPEMPVKQPETPSKPVSKPSDTLTPVKQEPKKKAFKKYDVKTTTDLNVRKNPNNKAKVVRILKKGTVAAVVGTTNDTTVKGKKVWLKLKAGEYISQQYTKKV